MKMRLQVLEPAKMGLQVLDPALGYNGQVRPRGSGASHIAMRIMNVQVVRFFSGKIERVCWQYVPYN
jgi:hypothetical protein